MLLQKRKRTCRKPRTRGWNLKCYAKRSNRPERARIILRGSPKRLAPQDDALSCRHPEVRAFLRASKGDGKTGVNLMTTPLAAKIARDYGTPAAVIDLDRVERNIARIQAACDAAGVANRPHIKTHKSPMLAKLQIAAGARGITCQKIGEAEVMAEAGIDDILISYNLIGEEKMARLGALQAMANMTVAADNPVVIAGLPQAAAASGRPLSVVVECDTGRKRAGVEAAAEAVALAREIAASNGLTLAGLMLYPTG